MWFRRQITQTWRWKEAAHTAEQHSGPAGWTDRNNQLHTSKLPPLPPRLVPEQVAAHTDDSVPGSVQTNVALEGGPVPLPFAIPAAAAAAAAAWPVAVAAALPRRESSSAGRPTVTRGPGIRGRHNV